MLKLLAGGIQQENAEHLEINQTAEQFGNATQQFVQIQNRSEFAGDFVEQQKDFCLLRSAGIQVGVFNASGHPRSNQRKQTFVLFVEIVLSGELPDRLRQSLDFGW